MTESVKLSDVVTIMIELPTSTALAYTPLELVSTVMTEALELIMVKSSSVPMYWLNRESS